MACFLWFIAELGWLAWNLRTEVDDGFNRAYVYGVIGGLAGTLVAAALADLGVPICLQHWDARIPGQYAWLDLSRRTPQCRICYTLLDNARFFDLINRVRPMQGNIFPRRVTKLYKDQLSSCFFVLRGSLLN